MGFFWLNLNGEAYQHIYKDIRDGKPFRQIASLHNTTESKVRELFYSTEYRKWLETGKYYHD